MTELNAIIGVSAYCTVLSVNSRNVEIKVYHVVNFWSSRCIVCCPFNLLILGDLRCVISSVV